MHQEAQIISLICYLSGSTIQRDIGSGGNYMYVCPIVCMHNKGAYIHVVALSSLPIMGGAGGGVIVDGA